MILPWRSWDTFFIQKHVAPFLLNSQVVQLRYCRCSRRFRSWLQARAPFLFYFSPPLVAFVLKQLKGDEMIPFLLLSRHVSPNTAGEVHVDRIGRRNISQHPTNFSRWAGSKLGFDLLNVSGAAKIWPDFWITNELQMIYWGHESVFIFLSRGQLANAGKRSGAHFLALTHTHTSWIILTLHEQMQYSTLTTTLWIIWWSYGPNILNPWKVVFSLGGAAWNARDAGIAAEAKEGTVAETKASASSGHLGKLIKWP